MKVSASNLDSKMFSVKSAVESQSKPRVVPQVSFRGTTKAGAELANDITKHMKAFPKSLEWLQRHNGEILNAVVTAIGTAFVAPVFIAFNPFSKEDKETRTYSAWRQPISAVLALATQYGIMVPYNKHLDKLASTGKFDRANLTALPAEGYLKSIIKSENKGRKFTKDEMAEAIKTKRNNAMWAAISEARQKHAGTDIKIEECIDDVARDAAKKQIESEFKAELEKMKPKAQEKFIEQKLPAIAKSMAEKQIAESAAVKFEACKLATEARNGGQTFEQLLANVGARLENFSGSEADKTLLTKVLDKLRCYGKYDNMKYMSFDEATKSYVASTKARVTQCVKIKKMIMAQAQEAEKVLKGYKTHTGMVVTLLTLPFSCGLLNWVYPRLMEIIMPQKKNKQIKTQQADNFQKSAALPGKEGK